MPNDDNHGCLLRAQEERNERGEREGIYASKSYSELWTLTRLFSFLLDQSINRSLLSRTHHAVSRAWRRCTPNSGLLLAPITLSSFGAPIDRSVGGYIVQ